MKIRVNGITRDMTIEEVAEYEASLPTQEELDAIELQKAKDAKIKQLPNPLDPVTIDGTTYNGGDSSASAIAGAVTLAQNLGETEVKLWDINNSISTYTFEEAINISAQIAKAYRDTQFAKYEKIAGLNACTTLEELEEFIAASKL